MEWQTPDDVVRSHLESGERLLWSGKPVQGLKLRSNDIFLIPFSLLWCGFAIFWEIMVVTVLLVNGEGEPLPVGIQIIFPLFGLFFVIVGLYIVFGRFFVDVRQRARTFYGVTDDRIIIVSGLFSRKLKSLDLRTLSDLSMTQKGNGAGSITFGPTHPFAAFFGGAAWPGAGMYAPPSFDLIPNVAEVYNIIRDAQKER